MIPHILIFDPSRERAEIVLRHIEELNYTGEHISEADDLWKMFSQERFQILIIDCEVLGKDKTNILETIQKNHSDLLVILKSEKQSWDQVAKYLNQHKAYDYLEEITSKDKFKLTIDRAFDYGQLKRKTEVIQEGENLLYKKMIEIFDWKKALTEKDSENIASDLIHQMNISLFQGSGIGTLMSVVSVLLTKSKFDEASSTYTIPKNLYDLIRENYESAKGMFDSMSISQNVIDDSFEIEELHPISVLSQIMEEEVRQLEEAASLRNQKISMSGVPGGTSGNQIRLHPGKMRHAVREVLINALKYSREKDTIYLIFFVKENFLELKVVNPAYENPDQTIGVSGKHEHLVFEPFYRISSVMDDSYVQYEQFRFGLGLPLVKKIIEQHKANVQIYTIENNIRPNKSKDVCLTIRLPIQK
ncbi:ATP-binding response regulator [Leptospira idonii]|uniref:histidine kinase n=1 Tax=Leptospira idonii TaxID=1193500 RepID=A0A4V3JXX8_9LEPT|nr:ATP-binding protein [Leptospira idonii]TGN19186.1 response regulator [Leptospira idonii]